MLPKRIPRPYSIKMPSPAQKAFNSYKLGLVDPFDDRVKGVRLPNDFATKTVTKVVTGFMNLSSSSTTNQAYLFTPSPLLSMYSPSVAGPPTSDMISYTNWQGVSQAVDQATLRAEFASWRLVAGGIRIKSALPITSSPVIIAVGTTPVVGTGPGPNYLNTVTGQTADGAANIIGDVVGIKPVNGQWGNILNAFSNYNRFNTQDVATQSLTIPFRPTDSRAFDFNSSLSTSGNYVTGQTVLDQVLVNSSGVINLSASDNEESYSYEGFHAIALEVKAGTTATRTLEIEYIYHLEGIPAGDRTGSNSNAMYEGAAVYKNAATHLMDVAWANRQPLYKIATSMTGTLFNSVDPALISTLIGLKL